MANQKASTFTVKSTGEDTDYFPLANPSTNYRMLFTVLWAYIQSKLKGTAATIATGGTIALSNNDYVVALVATNGGGAPVTFSVGTSAAGTQIIDSEVLAAGTTQEYVINHFNASAGNIHFTLSTGSLSVRTIKI
jgi:hypothetical protein